MPLKISGLCHRSTLVQVTSDAIALRSYKLGNRTVYFGNLPISATLFAGGVILSSKKIGFECSYGLDNRQIQKFFAKLLLL